MRSIFAGIVVYVALNLLIPQVWGWTMNHAPPWAVHLLIIGTALGCAAWVGLSDPVYVRLANPSHYPLSSTAIAVGLLAAVVGTGWWSIATKAGTAINVRLPEIEIKTVDGLSLPRSGGVITGEMAAQRKEHILRVKNTNRVDLRRFKARLQLPEPVIDEPPSAPGYIPAGVNVKWQPEPSAFVASASGDASVTLFGQRPKAEWLLEIDTLPALTEILFHFISITPRSSERGALENPGGGSLLNYLDGSYQIEGPDGWIQEEVIMPISFDPSTRIMKSEPPEHPVGKFKVTRRITGP